MRGVERITIFRQFGSNDRWGDPVSMEPPRVVKGCVIVPRGVGGEDNQNATTVISGLQVFCPPGTDVRATDQIEARGYRYEVDGEPADYRAANGMPRAIMLNLTRITG